MRAPCSKHRSLSFFFLMFLITSDIISWYFFPHTSSSLFAHHLLTRLDFLCHQRKNKDQWEEATKRQITCGYEKYLLLAEWFNEEKGCHWLGAGSWLQRCQAGASLVVQWLGVHLTMQWTQVQSLDWEDPLEKDMATHSSSFAWEIPWTEEPARLQAMVMPRVRYNLAIKPPNTV